MKYPNGHVFCFRSHESATGFYRVSVYFLAKILCDAIPIRSIPVGSFAVITYWMMGKYFW